MIEPLVRRIKADPGDTAAFLELGTALAGAVNLAGFTELLTYRHSTGGSGSALALEATGQLILTGRSEGSCA